MKTFIKTLFLLFCLSTAVGMQAQQKYYTNSGEIHFLSKALIENIEAVNNEVICLVDIESGEMAYKVPIKKFEFEKSLMEEHFNENYLESDKYPYSTFSGTIENMPELDITIDGRHDVTVKGDLTIHGVTQSIVEKGIIEVSGGSVVLDASFVVVLKEYKIKIPKIVFQNIAEKINVTIKATLQPYEK